MSAYEGARLLHGAPQSTVSLLVLRGNAADPHVVELVREPLAAADTSSRVAEAGTGYIRIAEFSTDTATRVQQALNALAASGSTRYIIDLRGTARGDLDDGIAVARMFIKDGTLAVRLRRGDQRESITHQDGDGVITAEVALLVDQGTSGAAEVFAAALSKNDRAGLIGQKTLGRAARQRLVKLPDDSGLLLTYLRYLTPDGDPIHETGLEPDVDVSLPEIEFGAAPPEPDAALQKAIEHLRVRKAA